MSDDRKIRLEPRGKHLDYEVGYGKPPVASRFERGTRPRSLAAGLNDSPAGLAAWILEKFEAWSDCEGDVERRFTKDELITNLMIYWVTGTIGTSFQPYRDVMKVNRTAKAFPPRGPARPSCQTSGNQARFSILPAFIWGMSVYTAEDN